MISACEEGGRDRGREGERNHMLSGVGLRVFEVYTNSKAFVAVNKNTGLGQCLGCLGEMEDDRPGVSELCDKTPLRGLLHFGAILTCRVCRGLSLLTINWSISSCGQGMRPRHSGPCLV